MICHLCNQPLTDPTRRFMGRGEVHVSCFDRWRTTPCGPTKTGNAGSAAQPGPAEASNQDVPGAGNATIQATTLQTNAAVITQNQKETSHQQAQPRAPAVPQAAEVRPEADPVSTDPDAQTRQAPTEEPVSDSQTGKQGKKPREPRTPARTVVYVEKLFKAFTLEQRRAMYAMLSSVTEADYPPRTA